MANPALPLPSPCRHPYYEAARERRTRLLQAPSTGSLLGCDVVARMRGGMGEILVVRTPPGTAPPALKVLKTVAAEGLDSSRGLAELADEALTMTRLETPGCMPLENVHPGVDAAGATVLHLRMPYCAGGSLADRLAAGAPSREETAAFLLASAAALAGLHREGFIHRDLKPQNLLLDLDDADGWTLRLADFGLSRNVAATRRLEGFAGTPAYAAPEQLRGVPPTDRIDVWAWGLIALQILLGRHPFSEALARLAEDRSLTRLADRLSSGPRTLPPDAAERGPRALASLIPACLDPDPARRPAMKEVLRSLLAGACVGVSQDGGHLGVFPEAADVAFQDPRLGLILRDEARKLGLPALPEHGCRIGTVSLPWPNSLKKAELQARLGTPGSLWTAVREIDRILGRWEDPASPLGQFVKTPDAGEFRTGQEEQDGEIRGTLPALPRGALLHFLNLRLQALIDLAGEGSSAAVEELRKLARAWTGLERFGTAYREEDVTPEQGLALGPTRESLLCRLVQASTLVGDFGQAVGLIQRLRKLQPWTAATERTFAVLLMAQGRWAQAAAACDKLSRETASTWPAMSIGLRLAAGRCALESGEPARALDLLQPHQGLNLDFMAVAFIAFIRQGVEPPPEYRESIVAALRKASRQDVVEARYLTELAWLLGGRESAVRLAREAVCNPRLYVPLNLRLRPIFEGVLKGSPVFTPSTG